MPRLTALAFGCALFLAQAHCGADDGDTTNNHDDLVRRLGSKNEVIAAAAKAELLARGPVSNECLDRVAVALAELAKMRAYLHQSDATTRPIATRTKEADLAIHYFAQLRAAEYLVEGLRSSWSFVRNRCAAQ